MNLSSTLVETVSIDYEDFNESFLTCATCLCKYFLHIANSVVTLTFFQALMTNQNILQNYCHAPTQSASLV